MPCYRCGARQVDPARGPSPWKRGVRGNRQVLICPGCQSGRDWASDLDRCPRCGGVRLVRRLGEVECRDCGQVGEAGDPHGSGSSGSGPAGSEPAESGPAKGGPGGGDAAGRGAGGGGAGAPGADLAEEVAQALDRVLGASRGPR